MKDISKGLVLLIGIIFLFSSCNQNENKEQNINKIETMETNNTNNATQEQLTGITKAKFSM